MEDKIIAQVRVSKTGQKTITIPRKYAIVEDDYVIITKLQA